MELDQLLDLSSIVAAKLLPILGAVALVFLAMFLRKLVHLVRSANDAVVSMKTTLESANRQLEALDKPMHTLGELSETVDNVHEASKKAMRSTLLTLVDNIGAIMDLFTGSKKTEEPVENVNDKEQV